VANFYQDSSKFAVDSRKPPFVGVYAGRSAGFAFRISSILPGFPMSQHAGGQKSRGGIEFLGGTGCYTHAPARIGRDELLFPLMVSFPRFEGLFCPRPVGDDSAVRVRGE
jgi:hypothetical protein